MAVKMRPRCSRTKRPRGALLQLGIEMKGRLFRVGGSRKTKVKHLSFVVSDLTIPIEASGGTVPGGQFDWGSHLLKRNTSSLRYPKSGWKSDGSCKGIRVLDCESDSSIRCESRS